MAWEQGVCGSQWARLQKEPVVVGTRGVLVSCVHVLHGCAHNVCVYTMICAATGARLLPWGLRCPDATLSPAAGGIYTGNVEIDISVCAYIYIFLPADFHTAQQEQGAR